MTDLKMAIKSSVRPADPPKIKQVSKYLTPFEFGIAGGNVPSTRIGPDGSKLQVSFSGPLKVSFGKFL